MRVESASSIQKVDSDDSIVTFQRDAADFFDSIGQPRRSCCAPVISGLTPKPTCRRALDFVGMPRVDMNEICPHGIGDAISLCELDDTLCTDRYGRLVIFLTNAAAYS